MKTKILFPLKFLILFILIIGCDKCKKSRILEEVNNGNDDPTMLITETWGTSIKNALVIANGAPDCTDLENFAARVEIEVRTASFDELTQSIVVDPDPYWEQVFLSQNFAKNTSSNDGTQITIEIPETGAYLIRYLVEIPSCSYCCHGTEDFHCSSVQTGNTCEAGFPRLVYEETFLSSTRPPFDQNLIISQNDFNVRMCVCGCDVDC